MTVGHVGFVGGQRNTGWAGPAVRTVAEGETCWDEGLYFRRIGMLHIDHGDGVGFLHIGIAQAWYFNHFSIGIGATGSAQCFLTGKSEGGKFKAGFSSGLLTCARDRKVFKHADVGDPNLFSVRGKRNSKGQSADAGTRQDAALLHVNGNHSKVGLINNVENSLRAIIDKITGIGIAVGAVVQPKNVFGAACLRIDQTNIAGIPFTGENVFFIFKSKAHEDAVKIIIRFLFLVSFANGGMGDSAPAFFFIEQYGERIFVGAAIGADQRLAVGADGQSPGAWSGGELTAQRCDDPATRENGFRTGSA